MFSPGLSIGCLLLIFGVSVLPFEINGYDSQAICSQGLSNCYVRDELLFDPDFEHKAVDIQDMGVRAELCCKDRRQCELCLIVELQLLLHPHIEMNDEEEASTEEDERAASVMVCCTASNLFVCKRVYFTINHSALPQPSRAQLSLVMSQPLCVTYSSTVLVSVYPNKSLPPYQELHTPSLDEVCSLDLFEFMEECDVPRVNTLIDQERHQIHLQVGGKNTSRQTLVCLQYETNGRCQLLDTTTIPLYAVTPCMCLQAWWHAGDNRSRRVISCPFKNHTGVIQRNEWKNLSMSMAVVQMKNALLLWNLSAPCRLDGQIWPCQRTEALRPNRCKEIMGLRRELSAGNWRQNNKGHWEIPGVFENISLQSPPCAMVKLRGMENELGPFCINAASRWRWDILIITVVPLLLLALILLFYFKDKIKRWAQGWLSGLYVQTVSGHVVLLSPPDAEDGVAEMVCGLGSFLRDQGLGVSLDQWCGAEICLLGPLPWLYSQLLRLDRLGGRVIVVLTDGAWQRAEEWTRQYRQPQMGREASNEKHSDVFSASLSCITADRRLGRAGERFLLVHFESCPAKLTCSNRCLPESLEGLTLFCLPSQNQDLLSELGRGGKSRTSGIWRWTAGDNGVSRYQSKEKALSTTPETETVKTSVI